MLSGHGSIGRITDEIHIYNKVNKMHIMYLTPEELRVAIYEAAKTNDMSSLNPEAVRTYHIKDS